MATLDDWTERFLAAAQAAGPAGSTLVSALQRLCHELMAMVGRAGADALLARAIQLAGRHDPAVAVVSDPLPKCEGIGEFLNAVDPASVNEIVIPIAAQVLDLLARFIGESLTRSLLARISPPSPLDPHGSFGR